MKCETCGKTKRVYKLLSYQCWSCLELRAQEELKSEGNPFATEAKVWKRRREIINR